MTIFHLFFALAITGGIPTYSYIPSSDVWLVLYGIFAAFFARINYSYLLIFSLLGVVFISKALIIALHNSELDPTFFLPVAGDLRLFFIILVVSAFRSMLVKIAPLVLTWHVLIYLSFNTLGEFNLALYKQAQLFWNFDHLNSLWLSINGIPSTIAGHAAPWRLSGHLPLPSYAGLFCLIFFSLFLYRILFNSVRLKELFILLSLVALTVYIGDRTGSTIFYIGCLLVSGLYFFVRFFRYSSLFGLALSVLIFISFPLLNFDFDLFRFLFAARLDENSNQMLLYHHVFYDLNIFVGSTLNYVPHFVSDNMVLIRVFCYGLLGLFFVYFVHIYFIISLHFRCNLYVYVLTLVMFCAELGVRTLSSPEIFFLIILSFLRYGSNQRRYGSNQRVAET